MQVHGIHYPALIVKNMQESTEFYGKLGLQVLYTEPNRDDAESVQTLLHAGAESFLMLVGPVDPNLKIAEASPGVGSMQYLTLNVTAELMDNMFHELASSGVQASEEIRRGYERLVFMEDPNGVLITLLAWVVEPPEGMSRAAVPARAAKLRDEAGAPFIEEPQLRRAIEELTAG